MLLKNQNRDCHIAEAAVPLRPTGTSPKDRGGICCRLAATHDLWLPNEPITKQGDIG